MAYARRDHGFGGGFKGAKKFGGASRSHGFSDRGGDRPEMFPATCSDCGNSCEVPFRPNGKKPVLCKSCFGQGGDFKPKFAERYEGGRSTGSDNVAEQLRSINIKLDAIIKALKANDLSL